MTCNVCNPSSHSIQTLASECERCTTGRVATSRQQGRCITFAGQVCEARGAHKMFQLKWNLDATPENKKRKVFMRSRRNNKKFHDTILWDESSRALQTGCRKPAPPGVATSPPRRFNTDSIISGGFPSTIQKWRTRRVGGTPRIRRCRGDSWNGCFDA